MATLVRFQDPERGVRLGVQVANSIFDVTEKHASLKTWLRETIGRPQAAIDELDMHARNSKVAYLASVIDAPAIPNLPMLLPPVDSQDVWAAGITYPAVRDRYAKKGMNGSDLYKRVYEAERPELFFKAQAKHVIGSYGMVGVRKDSSACVPEPVLALLLNPALEVVGYGIGLDMTARDLERQNPLYRAQAKVYHASCALGPGWLLQKLRAFPALNMHIIVMRGGDAVFEGEVNIADTERTIDNLTLYLNRSQIFPDGVVLLTGTGITPPDDFTLRAGDSIRVSLDGAGKLITTAVTV
jgi:2-dehydro-3-deoxy-D-arabinonate dehydratase